MDRGWTEERKIVASESMKKRWESGEFNNQIGAKKPHSVETKRKISESVRIVMKDEFVAMKHRLGCKNRIVSSFGRYKQSVAQKKRFLWDTPPMSKPENVLKAIKSNLRNSGGFNNGVRNKFFMYNNIPMASSWEVIFANWLDCMGLKWEYQPIVFKTESGRYYVPDFRVEDFGFVEVKGWLKQLSIEKMDEFVSAGNTLYLIRDPRDLNKIVLNGTTRWLVPLEEATIEMNGNDCRSEIRGG